MNKKILFLLLTLLLLSVCLVGCQKEDHQNEDVSDEAYVVRIEIQQAPDKTEYFVNEELDTTGLVLKVFYSDGTIENVTEGFLVSAHKLTSDGNQMVFVSYENKIADFMVNVVKDTVSKLEILTEPAKTTYYKGETLNTTGLKLKATYASGNTETITSGFTCTPNSGFTTAGSKTITVSYGNKTTTFTITILEDAVAKIEVTTKPTKTSYYKGETLNTAGMQVKATYASGKTETITSGFTCSPTTLNTVGTQTITITYGGKTATFTVSVQAETVTSISVKSNPINTTYYNGETLDTTGLSLTVQYNTGKTTTVTSGFTHSASAALSTTKTEETQSITVYYSGKTAVFPITVKYASVGLKYYEYSSYVIVDGIGSCTDKAIVIPPRYNGKPVTEIDESAFEDCTSLTSISIPSSVTEIGPRAFYDCTSLTSIDIPSSVTTINSSAFYNTGYYNNSANWTNNVLYIGKYLIEAKTTLSGSYIIKSGTLVIADRAFSYCTSLTSVSIPNSVTEISPWAFENCTSLTSISIPNSVTEIGSAAFGKCTSLTSISIPNSVTKIGSYAFSGCNSLTSISIPNSVTEIGYYAFGSCTSLTSVSIPSSVTKISQGAFYRCTSLTSISIPNSVTEIGSEAFGGCTSLETIYCEAESKPTGWASDWLGGCTATVHWGYKEN